MPKTSIKVLPSEFTRVYSLLDTDTSELLPLFFSKFEESYKELPLVICNDTLISLCLTIPVYNSNFFSILNAGHCIPPLLWLLTYSPDHLKLASAFLPEAISKANGINEFLLAFGRGDNTFKLKNLAIKILKSVPINNKIQYLQKVIPQMILIITEYKCDVYIENILENALNFLLEKNPEILLQILNEMEKTISVDELVKLYQILSQSTPPHNIILFRISSNFILYLNLFEYLCDHVLDIKNKLLRLLNQFFGY